MYGSVMLKSATIALLKPVPQICNIKEQCLVVSTKIVSLEM